MMTEHQALLDEVVAAIDNDSLVLPTLPDVAIKIQDLIDDPNVSADQIVQILSSDPLISAQLIKTANSALFADKVQVENVRGAVTRLGYRQLRNLVMTITMKKMFYAKNSIINKYRAPLKITRNK
ncbi:MAG: signal transduction [Gallionellaceae bacterium]|nr:MAG: signal transduction [Gallionellaceae bacterium]